ncbi:MAG: hypothetical protein HGA43_05495, partial [Nitrospirae bacterium]|nr:hypothetical protein [Nitrospirota bacterium]
DTVPVEQVRAYEEQLLAFMESRYPAVLQSIGELKDLAEDAEKVLVQAMNRFTRDFLQQKEGSHQFTPAT